MATSENSNQATGLQGSGNWSFIDGKWQSSEGSTLDNSSAGGGASSFGAGGAGGGASSFGASDGNPLAGGGNNVSSDSNYAYNREADKQGSTDTNNPFNQLLGAVGGDVGALDGGNASGGNASGGENLPGNLPFGSTPPSEQSGSNLPETGNGKPVPYNSENWTEDLKNLDSSASATNNTGEGNGNWNLGSNNKTDGNGNWNFGSDNTTKGNGNWNYAEGNSSEGNGNWGFGSDNDILGNANMPTGNNNDILGSGNTADVNDSNLLGNRIEASGDGKTLIGNEDWNFSVSGELTSLGSSTPGEAIGTDVKTLLDSPDLIASTTSKPGYFNDSYDYSATV